VRVIAGVARGFPLKGPPGPDTRATSDKVRGAIFDALAPYIEDARVLDLYAGTGALGIEALSRGAAACLFVEKASAACRVIEANLRVTKLADGAAVWYGTVEKALDTLAPPSPASPLPPPSSPASGRGRWAGSVPGRAGHARLSARVVDGGGLGGALSPGSPGGAEGAEGERRGERAAVDLSQAQGEWGVRAAFNPPYDIITLDPPYHDSGIGDVLERVGRPGLVAQDGFVILEHGKRWAPPPHPGVLRLRRTRLYGDTGVTLWQREEAED